MIRNELNTVISVHLGGVWAEHNTPNRIGEIVSYMENS